MTCELFTQKKDGWYVYIKFGMYQSPPHCPWKRRALGSIYIEQKKSRRNNESSRCQHSSLGPEKHQFFEGFTKLGVEDGVDDRIHETIHVAQPCGEQECCHTGLTGKIKFAAHRIHDVAREERHPADEKHSWKATNNIRTPFHFDLLSAPWPLLIKPTAKTKQKKLICSSCGRQTLLKGKLVLETQERPNVICRQTTET